ncbi:MAG: hypothetical protein HS115_04175 [Spirochaetales bacterium]|nr:hypothetical protein [Spirochaetales bacterium]
MTTIPFPSDIWATVAFLELLIILGLLFLRKKRQSPVDMRNPDQVPPAATPQKKGPTGRIEDQHGDAIYGSSDDYDKDDYLGRLSRGAEIELVDRRVLRNEFDVPIIKVRVLSNEWKDELGKTGWVGLAATSYRLRFDPESHTIMDAEIPPPERNLTGHTK